MYRMGGRKSHSLHLKVILTQASSQGDNFPLLLASDINSSTRKTQALYAVIQAKKSCRQPRLPQWSFITDISCPAADPSGVSVIACLEKPTQGCSCKPIQELTKPNSTLKMQLNASMQHQHGFVLHHTSVPNGTWRVRKDQWWAELGNVGWWGCYRVWSTAIQLPRAHLSGTSLRKMLLVGWSPMLD